MDDSEIRHAVELLATAYRELAVLVDRAELEGLSGHGEEGHLLALRKACRDLTDFSELVTSLAEEGGRQGLEQENLEFDYRFGLVDRLREADSIQLEAVLRTQERLFREVGVDDETTTRLVDECRASLRAVRDPAHGQLFTRSLPEVFTELAGQTCHLAEVFQQPKPPDPEVDENYYRQLAAQQAVSDERRTRARKVLRVTVKAFAAAAAVGIGLVATPILGLAAASVLQAAAGVLLDAAASSLLDHPDVQVQVVEVHGPDATASASESSQQAREESGQRGAGADEQEREAGA